VFPLSDLRVRQVRIIWLSPFSPSKPHHCRNSPGGRFPPADYSRKEMSAVSALPPSPPQSTPDRLGADGKHQVTPGKVRFDTKVALDEIDLESGFVMLPQAIPQPAPATATGQAGTTTPGTSPTPTSPTTPGAPVSGTPTPAAGTLQKLVELKFTADKDKIFSAGSAVANLAEMAGGVTVTVHAEKSADFDKSKLQNGVLKPSARQT
jgi:hypothetical protein